MTRRALFLAAALALVAALRGWPSAPLAGSPVSTLPPQLTGPELWTLSAELSEPDGFFRSDNLVSNELYMQRVIPDLMVLAKPGRAYLGVGPEQNFTYIAAIKPAIAFIIDIRRGNLRLHLMYKALFELSADRSEFVSRLFSLKRHPELGKQATAKEIFAAYSDPDSRSEELYTENASAIRDVLTKTDRLALSTEDLKGIEDIYREFFGRGPGIHYEITPGSAGAFPSFADLMAATDGSMSRSFLASEELFNAIRDLEKRNLVIPIVGNFAGPKAIRAVGQYLRSHDTLVAAFYVSNVEQYLEREGGMEQFCASAATLPVDDSSTFIRSERGGFAARGPGWPRWSTMGGGGNGFGGAFSSQLHNIRNDVKNCTAGR
jgi:hypothetical protein